MGENVVSVHQATRAGADGHGSRLCVARTEVSQGGDWRGGSRGARSCCNKCSPIHQKLLLGQTYVRGGIGGDIVGEQVAVVNVH